MLNSWLKFVAWTTIIGTIIRFIVTRLIGQPFFGLMATMFGGIEYIFILIQMIISGIILGSIIFGVWYAFSGRKKK